VLVVLGACVLLFVQPPLAAVRDPLTLAYERVLAAPSDLQALHAYAEDAIKAGEFEAAIGVLEGILAMGRDQPRILLELGALYRRLGAEQMAQAYLDRARAAAGGDAALATLADELLDATSAPEDRHRLDGFVDFGLRWQSNPALSPESSEILARGLRVPLQAERRRDADINLDLFTWLEHRYRIDEHRSIDTEIIGYATFYDRESQLDTALLEVTSGPSWRSARNAAGQWRVRPHLLLRGSFLDRESFERTAGVGVDLQRLIGSSANLIGTYQFRDVNFTDIDGFDASLQSGWEHRLDLRAFWEFAFDQLVMLRALGLMRDARRDYYDLDQLELTLRYSLKLPNPLPSSEAKLTLSPFVARRLLDYGGADPDVAPMVDRRDREWRFGLDAELPLGRVWSAILRLEHADIDSNLSNYETDNNLVQLGLRLRF
jgi:hypothetical protein